MLESTPSDLVLIVDDNEMIRDLLKQHICKQGHQVMTAARGAEALKILAVHPIDLIVLDIMMPGMNGVEVLEHVKSDPNTCDIPVLVLSADSDMERIITCISLGAEDYLVKPFNPVFLKVRINTCLEKRHLRTRERSYQVKLEELVAERTALARQRALALKRQSAILQSILDSMGDGVVVVDTEGNLIHHNPAAASVLGDRIIDFLPNTNSVTTTFRHNDQVTVCLDQDLPLAQAIHGHAVDGMELFMVTAQDDAVGQWLSITARPLSEHQGKVTGGVAVIRDVSEAKRAEIALRKSEERYALAAYGANDGLWDWDLSSNEVYFSPRWKEMLGYTEQEIGSSINEWLDRLHPDDRERFDTNLVAHQQCLITHIEIEYRILHKNGSYYWMLCRGIAMWDKVGQTIRMAGSQTDITHRKRVEEKLLHDAFHDGLTGLPNRVFFVARLENVLQRMRARTIPGFTVFFLDLDRFKVVNDSLGHMVGDQLLITVARRLEECVRPGHIVARFGGDEFTILFEDIHDTQTAYAMADHIQTMLSATLYLDEHETFTTASIGILLHNTDNSDYKSATDIIRDVDTAMYHAKIGGKARSMLFDPVMHTQAMSQLRLEADLRWAIERNELRVHYQPIVAMDTTEIVGFEALVRWQHPLHGLLFPGEFLKLAEETGLIVPISWWILRVACRQLHEWQRQIPGAASLWMSVNLSVRQLLQSDMVDQVRCILDETGLEAHSLKLEITEHALMEYGEVTTRLLTELRDMGIQLCIDDFGTGYSSLSYLQRFPIDVLKIDRSFINQIGDHGQRSEIVKTIIELVRILGLQAVAEGTETIHQARELQRLKCDFGQGWLFSKAVEAAEIETLIRQNREPIFRHASPPGITPGVPLISLTAVNGSGGSCVAIK